MGNLWIIMYLLGNGFEKSKEHDSWFVVFSQELETEIILQ